MQVEARLYEERVSGESIWYLDCPAIPACTPRRRVLLVVDTTDSFWPAQKPFIETFLRRLTTLLEPGDICVLWAMGEYDPVIEYRRGLRPEGLTQALLEPLRPFANGSWLQDTIDGITDKVKSHPNPDGKDYLLVITDGVIYDAVAVCPPECISREQILMITPTLVQGDLGMWSGLLRPWAPAVMDLLERTPQTLWIDPNPGQARAVYRYDPEPIRRIGGRQAVRPGAAIGLCYLGGEEPQPLLRSETSDHGFRWINRQSGRPGQAVAMERIAELVLAPWDRMALNTLLKDGRGQVTHCGVAHMIDRSPPNKLKCPHCGGCLLVGGNKPFPVTDSDQSTVLVFPLPLKSDELPEHRSPIGMRVRCYEVHSENDRNYLVLKFIPFF